MSAVQQLAAIPVPYIAAILAGNVVPYLSALATRKPGWWTGAATVALSLVSAVLAALAHAGSDDWRQVGAVAALTWVMARLHLNTLLKGTQIEVALHSVGNAAPAPGD